VVLIDKELNEQIIKDMKIISKEIMPKIEEQFKDNDINMVSAIFYFATLVRDLIPSIEDEDLRAGIKEMAIRYMLDEA